eukprot:sb/3478046/
MTSKRRNLSESSDDLPVTIFRQIRNYDSGQRGTSRTSETPKTNKISWRERWPTYTFCYCRVSPRTILLSLVPISRCNGRVSRITSANEAGIPIQRPLEFKLSC